MLAQQIIRYIPHHKIYVEPFCGGASILFAKPIPAVTNRNHYKEYINDHDRMLINMYRIFQTRFDEIEHLLVNTLFSQDEHRLAKDICKGIVEADDITKAWAYYVNIQQSFAGNLNKGWRIGRDSPNNAGIWRSKITQLNQYRDRLANVHVFCTDAIRIIKRLDSPDSFFYCDPPYPGANQGHYSGYTQNDFEELIEVLRKCEGSAIVSCYAQIVPAGWKSVEFSVKCVAASKNKNRTEMILIKEREKRI